MKPLRIAVGLIGIIALLIASGGMYAIIAYANGDASVWRSMVNLVIGSFNFSWILGVIILGLLILFITMFYTGLRRSKS